MAFGIERVIAAVSDLASALRQEAQGITQAIDSARQSTSNELADTRAGLKESIAEARREAGDARSEAAAARRDIAALHAVIEGWRAEAAASRQAAEEAKRALEQSHTETDPAPAGQAEGPPAIEQQQPEEETGTGGEAQSRHYRLLLTAAGIAAAKLVCHRDLWAFLIEQAADEQHFRVPGEVKDSGGNVEVTLSGRSLIAALTALWEVRRGGAPNGDWALACELYRAISSAVESVVAAPTNGSGRVEITIDRRPSSPTQPAEGTEPPENLTA